jgi:thioester reductase-like protein
MTARALFLTGATGMVGREVLVRAARDVRFDRVFCLVRPGKGESAQQRLDALLGKVGVAADGRIAAVAGDVTEDGLGLSEADRKALSDVTVAIHCAATVSFDHPLEEARKINVAGTQAVVQLCRGLPKLERLDAVSTAYVAGCRDDLVREGDLEHERGFHNTYEQTKHESEILLRAAMKDLPIAVHRPSIVVGDSRTGRTGAWKVLYWPLKVIARGWLPVIPYDPEGRLDIVPVDFVADGILALSRDPGAIGGTFHLTAGPGRDTTMEEVTTRVFARLERRKPMRVSPGWWRGVVRPALMLAPSKKLKRTLSKGLVYRPYLELRLQFDTAQADAHLAPAGVRCPKVAEYIDTIVDAAIESDFGAKTGES